MNQTISGRFNASATDHSSATVNVSYHTASPALLDATARAEAERLLDALPLDGIPAPSPPPPGSHLPTHFNRQFGGRAEELTTLARVLKEGGAPSSGRVRW